MRRTSDAQEKPTTGESFGPCSRRTLIAPTGAVAAATAFASSRGLAESPTPTELWSGAYTATKQSAGGPVQLALYRRRLGPPRSAESRPVIFLVHGSSISARPSYDLSVPGHGEYSLMNVLARAGY